MIKLILLVKNKLIRKIFYTQSYFHMVIVLLYNYDEQLCLRHSLLLHFNEFEPSFNLCPSSHKK